MKMKRWLSRGIVLAMVVALMVPMPVLAKAKSGGKLVKSVTSYSYNEKNGRWKATNKVDYKYDKKNNPKEIAKTAYSGWFLGNPVSGTKTVETAKYKYKGKTPKSAKFKDGAGKVTETRKYKKGRVVSIATSRMTSDEEYDDNTGAFIGDSVSSRKTTTTVSYNKKGLATAESYSRTSGSNEVSGASNAESYSSNSAYAVTHKKGIPSLIIDSYSYTEASSNSSGYSYSYTRNADGSWVEVSGGTTDSGKSDEVWSRYTRFNGKGLAIELGSIKTVAATGVQTVYPEYNIQYTTKKGKVTQAIVNDLETNEAGVVTKITPMQMYKFKYTKKKVSKVRYLSMMNSLIGYHNAFFAWY